MNSKKYLPLTSSHPSRAKIEFLQRRYAPNKKVRFNTETATSPQRSSIQLSSSNPVATSFSVSNKWNEPQRVMPSEYLMRPRATPEPSPFEKVNSQKWHPKTLDYMRQLSPGRKYIDPELLYMENPSSPTFRGEKREITPVRTMNPQGFRQGSNSKLSPKQSPRSNSYKIHADKTLKTASSKMSSSASTLPPKSSRRMTTTSSRSRERDRVNEEIKVIEEIRVMEQKQTLEDFYRPLYESYQQKPVKASLHDLDEIERAKIGALVKKLADEKEEKERIRRELEERDHLYRQTIEGLKKANEDILHDAFEVKEKFTNSLGLLNSYKKLAHDLQMSPPKVEKVFIHSPITPRSPKQLKEYLTRSEKRRKYGGILPEESSKSSKKATINQSRVSRSVDSRTWNRTMDSKSLEKTSIQEEPTRDKSPSPPKRLIPMEPGKAARTLLEAIKTRKGDASNSQSRNTSKHAPDASISMIQQNNERTLSELKQIKGELQDLKHTFQTEAMSPTSEHHRITSFNLSKGFSHLIPSQQSPQVPVTKKGRSPNQSRILGKSPDRNFSSPQITSGDKRITSGSKRINSSSKGLPPMLPMPVEKPKRPSSDEESKSDELEIAVKWLALRKKKIEALHKEIDSSKYTKRNHKKSSKEHLKPRPRTPTPEISRSPPEEPVRQRPKKQKEPQRALFFQPSIQSEEVMTPKLSTQIDLYNDPGSFRPTNPSIDIYQSPVQHQHSVPRMVQSSQDNVLSKKLSKASVKSSETTSYNISQTNQTNKESNSRTGSDPFVFSEQVTFSKPVDKSRQSLDQAPVPSKRNSRSAHQLIPQPQQPILLPVVKNSIDLNSLSVPEMLELRKVLEDRLNLDKINHNLDNLQHSAQKKLEKIEEMLNLSQDLISQSMGTGTQALAQLQQTQELQGRLTAFSGTGTQTRSVPRTSERYKVFEATDKVPQSTLDYSLVRDFDSIRGTPVPHKERDQDVNQRNEEELQKIYQQKLNELIEVKEQIARSKRSEYEAMILEDVRKSSASRGSSRERERYQKILSPPTKPYNKDSKGSSFTNNDLELSDNSNPQSFVFDKRQNMDKSPTDGNKGKRVSFIREELSKKISSVQQEIDTSSSYLSQDFYDIGLVDLVEDIEKRQVANKLKEREAIQQNKQRKHKDKPIEEEFGSLFNTVRTMASAPEDDEVMTIERGLKRMERGELQGKTISWDEDTDRFLKNKYATKDSARSATSGQTSQRNMKRNDSSSVVESDQSILLINKKIQDLKNEQKRLTEKKTKEKEPKNTKQQEREVTFRKKL